MPVPGSHEYRRQHERIRRELEEQGVPDHEAKERADAAMADTEHRHVDPRRSGGGSRQGAPWPDRSAPGR